MIIIDTSKGKAIIILKWYCYHYYHLIYKRTPQRQADDLDFVLNLASIIMLSSNTKRNYRPLSLCLVVGGELIKQFAVHLHEGFEDVIDQGHDGLVPVVLGDAVESREHDGQHSVAVLVDEVHDVLIVPEVQRPLCHLMTQGQHKGQPHDNKRPACM